MANIRQRFSAADARAVRSLARSQSTLGKKVNHALQVIEEAIQRYGDTLALSFNGGKDCTVLVHLYAAAAYQDTSNSLDTSSDALHLPTHNSTNSTASSSSSTLQPSTTNSTTVNGKNHHSEDADPSSLTCIYVQCQSPFPQVEEFVEDCRERYNLDLMKIKAGMKDALTRFKKDREEHHGTKVEAVLVGTRRGDPFGETLREFTPTDKDWPHLMRVHPILDWTYDDIWDFLRCEDLGKGGIGWCSLYDFGYTSLGSTFNTIPNPLLRDTDSPTGWRPAWELKDHSAERAGRPAGPIPKEVIKTLDPPSAS